MFELIQKISNADLDDSVCGLRVCCSTASVRMKHTDTFKVLEFNVNLIMCKGIVKMSSPRGHVVWE